MESKQIATNEHSEYLNRNELPIWLQAGLTIVVLAAGIVLYYAM
jgi:hypothetical protein